MIIVRLMGGLGNQLFQYAAGRSLAYRHNSSLKLDISLLKTVKGITPRLYMLSPFSITENFITEEELRQIRYSGGRMYNQLISFAGVLSNLKPIFLVKEQGFTFNPGFLLWSDNICLQGYWQSEKYFHPIKEIIRQEFTIRTPPDPINKNLEKTISSVNAVSIHVRRTDYVTNPDTTRTHGVCGVEYYQNAITEMMRAVDAPHFFVFSDDPSWARSNINANAPIQYICHNDLTKSHEDLRLMIQCHHHIIANSSFSWWAAWLCRHPDKIIISPKRWFNQPGIDTRDLIPESWIRL